MRHLMKGRRLNRSPAHLKALRRDLVCRLFIHERIITTVAKAKEMRSFAEKIITLAKKGAEARSKSDLTTEEGKKQRLKALHYRRLIMSYLGGDKKLVIDNGKESETINVVDKLMNDIGPRFKDRPGGYTRVLKRMERRLGDAAPTAIFELLGANEPLSSKKKKKREAAVAPVVAPEVQGETPSPTTAEGEVPAEPKENSEAVSPTETPSSEPNATETKTDTNP